MITVDALPPDQRAVLQLVLQQGRSYDEIAGMLAIDRAAVRQRALDALVTLASGQGASAPERGLVTDYLLGQLPPRVAEQVLLYLESSPRDRAWAAVVSARLAPLASAPLPAVPGFVAPIEELPPSSEAIPREPAAPEAQPATQPRPDASTTPPEPQVPANPDMLRAPVKGEAKAEPVTPPEQRPAAPVPQQAPPMRQAPTPAIGHPSGPPPPKRQRPRRPRRFPGNIAILAAVVAAVIVFVAVLIATGGSPGPQHRSGSQASTSPVNSSPTTSTAPNTVSTPTATKPQILATLHLTSPSGAAGAGGVAQVVRKAGVDVIVIAAEGLPANTAHDAYAVWLYNSATSSAFVGWVPNLVGRNGKLRTEGKLPPDAASYRRLLITLETQASPRVPGRVILSGRFRVNP